MPQVAIVQGSDPYETTMKALKLITSDIIIPNSPIFLKPNLLVTRKDPIAVTNPKVCAAVADFLREEKEIIDIQLGEGTSGGNPASTFRSMRNNGYTEFLDRWEPVDLSRDPPRKWFPIESPGTLDELTLGIALSVISSPYLVSIPKFKTHDVLGLTLSLKNLMGSLTAAKNSVTKKFVARESSNVFSYMHGFAGVKPDKLTEDQITGKSKVALATNLIRLAKVVQPSLAVIDGIDAMDGDGPSKGTKKELNLIIAGTDFIAVDTVATHIAGMDPLHFQYIHQAGLMGLGEYRLDQITLLGETSIDAVRSPFRPHRLYKRSKFTADEISTLETDIN